MELQEQEIKFPVDWTYRVIVVSSKEEAVVAAIKQIMLKFGVLDDLKLANVSSSGTYKTYSFRKQLNCREEMENIANSVSDIDGVKVVI